MDALATIASSETVGEILSMEPAWRKGEGDPDTYVEEEGKPPLILVPDGELRPVRLRLSPATKKKDLAGLDGAVIRLRNVASMDGSQEAYEAAVQANSPLGFRATRSREHPEALDLALELPVPMPDLSEPQGWVAESARAHSYYSSRTYW